MADDGARATRSDAVGNRRRLLAVARSMLTRASRPDDVTMKAIAQRAGVGQGTLYRHFASREELVVAVFESDVEALIASATRLADADSPSLALRRWLVELADYGQLKRGISEIVLGAATSEDIATTWRPRVLDAVQGLLDAGRASGDFRDDVDARDLWDLVAFLWLAPISPERAERLTGVVLDGLSVTA